MSPREEIDLWFTEQIAIHGEPATDDDLDRIADSIIAAHEFSPAHMQYMIAAENKRLIDKARNWTN